MMNYGEAYAPDFDSEFEELDWAFGCTEEKFSIDARNLIMNELDSNGWYDDAFDDVSEEKLAELQLYLDSWCECVPISFQADESVVVLAPEWKEPEWRVKESVDEQ